MSYLLQDDKVSQGSISKIPFKEFLERDYWRESSTLSGRFWHYQ
jgi:hypothetical protein